MFEQISNKELKLEHLPAREAEWDNIALFALSFDAYKQYGSFEDYARVANDRLKAFGIDKSLSKTLTDLRACLFFEQRRWHHFGRDPDEETMEYIHALLEAIREKISSENNRI